MTTRKYSEEQVNNLMNTSIKPQTQSPLLSIHYAAVLFPWHSVKLILLKGQFHQNGFQLYPGM
jgi:hypothetical protein